MSGHEPCRVAIWIDHRTAILNVSVGDRFAAEQVLHCEEASHPRGDGGSQHRIEAHQHELVRDFYDQVVQQLAAADEILLLGPGQAKYELRRRIERHKSLQGKVVAVHNAARISKVELITISAPALGVRLDGPGEDQVLVPHELLGDGRHREG